MTDVQARMIKGQIALTFRRLGGKTYDILRTPTDLNGQPTGEGAIVGQLFGLCYRDVANRPNIHIALPGILADTNDIPTITALLLCGEAPQKGDILSINGKTTRMLSVNTSGPLHIATLEEVI